LGKPLRIPVRLNRGFRASLAVGVDPEEAFDRLVHSLG
jgi:hypothetical protein